MVRRTDLSELRRGWKLLLAANLGFALGLAPVPAFTIGMFAPHLMSAFGWRQSEILAGMSVMTFTVLLASPLASLVAERVGVRRVAIVSLILFGLVYTSFSLSNGSLPLYYAQWFLLAMVGAGTLPATWTRTVNQAFDLWKGLALGIAATGGGLSGALLKPLTATLIENFGWRGAYVGIGLLPVMIAAPVALFFFRDVEPARGDPTPARSGSGLTLRDASRTAQLWIIMIALSIACFSITGIILNLETLLHVSGASHDKVVQLASFIGISSVVGRLVGGWLLDQIWAPAAGCIVLCLAALGCWVLSLEGAAYLPDLLGIALVGFALGVELDLLSYLTARYFGMKRYAAIFGILFAVYFAAGGLGPFVFGWMFDRSGSYELILRVAGGMLAASAVSLLALGRYRFPR
jgi:predicted MFS family arabinose efflux permease